MNTTVYSTLWTNLAYHSKNVHFDRTALYLVSDCFGLDVVCARRGVHSVGVTRLLLLLLLLTGGGRTPTVLTIHWTVSRRRGVRSSAAKRTQQTLCPMRPPRPAPQRTLCPMRPPQPAPKSRQNGTTSCQTKCRLQFVILDRSLRLGASRLIFSKSAGEISLDVLICSLSDFGILMGMRMLFVLRPPVDIQVWSFKFSEF